jgi:6-phosphogluconolactonase
VRRLAGLWVAGLCGLALAPAVAQAQSSGVYAVNFVSNDVSQFGVGSGGALSPLATPTVGAGMGPFAIAINPDGQSVYVANDLMNGAGAISQYKVGPSDALTPMSPATVAGANEPTGIAVSPDGKDVYVADNAVTGGAGVSQYTVGPSGALTPTSTVTVAARADPLAIAVGTDGRSVYVTDENSNGPDGVLQYTVGPSGGLTPMADPAVASGSSPFAVTVSPNGKYAYVANFGSTGPDGVSQYTVGPGGGLSPMTPATVATGNSPIGVAVSPNGENAYVANFGSSGQEGISQYSVGPTGALSPIVPATVDAGQQPESVVVSPDGKSVYVANGSADGPDGVSQYDVGAGGALTPKMPAAVAADNQPAAIAMVPDQGPAAAFSATAAQAGTATSFNASTSSDPDGTIATYAWSFGDGSSETTMSPLVTHVYSTAGSYTATLTVTDDSGCSTAFVFTGQTASCNGGPRARVSHKVTIPAPPSPPAPTHASSPTDNHFTVSNLRTHRDGKITFAVKLPGSGTIDVLETAWNDNLAHAAIRLAPAPRRFVVARAHKSARRATTLHLQVRPNIRGRQLVRHHTYPVTLRMWVTYTPTGGGPRSIGFHGLRLPR